MDGTVPQTGFLPGRNRQNVEKQLLGRASASGLAGKRGFFANLPANRGFGRGRCDMAAFGGRFALHMPRHWPCGGVCALRAALSARLSAREASHRSGTRLRAQQPPIFSAFAARPALCLAKMRGFPAAGLPRALFSSLLFLQA